MRLQPIILPPQRWQNSLLFDRRHWRFWFRVFTSFLCANALLKKNPPPIQQTFVHSAWVATVGYILFGWRRFSRPIRFPLRNIIHPQIWHTCTDFANRAATRIAERLNSKSYERRLKDLNMYSAEEHGLIGNEIETFKILMGLPPVGASNIHRLAAEDKRTRLYEAVAVPLWAIYGCTDFPLKSDRGHNQKQ